jgi:hypothetical protein
MFFILLFLTFTFAHHQIKEIKASHKDFVLQKIKNINCMHMALSYFESSSSINVLKIIIHA